jgi:hypothetical protein
LKVKLKGHRLNTIEVIEAESQAVLNTLTEHDKITALEWCIHKERDYFEG